MHFSFMRLTFVSCLVDMVQLEALASCFILSGYESTWTQSLQEALHVLQLIFTTTYLHKRRTVVFILACLQHGALWAAPQGPALPGWEQEACSMGGCGWTWRSGLRATQNTWTLSLRSQQCKKAGSM